MKKTIAQLRTYFETGDVPTQQQFWDWLDSFIHKDEGVVITSVVEGAEGFTVTMSDDSSFLIPLFEMPSNMPISYITGLQTFIDAVNLFHSGLVLTDNNFTNQNLQDLNDLIALLPTGFLQEVYSNGDLSLCRRTGDILHGILDQYTGEAIRLKLIDYTPDLVDNIIFFQLEDEYFKRIFVDSNVDWFGTISDGSTDNTEAFQKALNFLLINGGRMIIPPKTYLIEGQLEIPDSMEVTNPKMSSTILQGSGANHTGRGTAPIGGTILDMRFDGTYGKMIGLGLGFLKITDISFADYGDSDTPFIYTTYPTLHIKDNSFYGSKAGVLSAQDAIVMGGVEDSEGPRGFDVGFQGYGTIIEGNYFSRIRRAVYGRVFFNANVIQNNTIWNTCGTNDDEIGAIELDGDPENNTAQRSTGNVITGNLIEATHYAHCIVLRETEKNTLIANNFYDKTIKLQTYHKLHEDSALYNYIVSGFHDDDVPYINEEALSGNTIVNIHQNQESSYSESNAFRNFVKIIPPTGDTVSDRFRIIGAGGSQIFERIYADNEYFKVMIDESNVEKEVESFKNFGSGVLRKIYKGTDVRIESEGNMKIRSFDAGSELWLGDTAAMNIYIVNGVLYSNKSNGTAPISVLSKTPVANFTPQRIDNGTLIASNDSATDGAKIFTGTGTPEGNITALVGSLYTRTDGGANTTLYVKESGTGNTGWIAK